MRTARRQRRSDESYNQPVRHVSGWKWINTSSAEKHTRLIVVAFIMRIAAGLVGGPFPAGGGGIKNPLTRPFGGVP
jgi:hypothetical protein